MEGTAAGSRSGEAGGVNLRQLLDCDESSFVEQLALEWVSGWGTGPRELHCLCTHSVMAWWEVLSVPLVCMFSPLHACRPWVSAMGAVGVRRAKES